MYASIQDEHMRHTEERRQQFFDHLRKYQENNDLKAKALSNFLGNDIASLAKRDEAQYMKAVAEKEEQAQRKETENNRNQQRTKSNTKDGLAFQIHEREALRRLKEL